MLVVALSAVSAAKAPAAGLCIPLLGPCDSGEPSPTPTSGPLPLIPGIPIPTVPGLPIPDGIGPSVALPAPVVGVPDPGAPTFTLPAAQLGGSSISFTGLQSVTVVTVPLVNGTRTTALKIMADTVTVEDFVLDVRKATGPSLVTTATRMELKGNVQVYLNSVTASLLDGTALTLGANTPPPGDELPSTLLRVNLGLIGVTANSISFLTPHQAMK